MKMIKDLFHAIVFVATIVGASFCIVSAIAWGGQIVGGILGFLMMVGLVWFMLDAGRKEYLNK